MYRFHPQWLRTKELVDAGDIGAGHQVTAIYEVVPVGGKGWIAPRKYEDAPAQAATVAVHSKRVSRALGMNGMRCLLLVRGSAHRAARRP